MAGIGEESIPELLPGPIKAVFRRERERRTTPSVAADRKIARAPSQISPDSDQYPG